MAKMPEIWEEVTALDPDGHKISGRYSVSRSMITVEAFGGRKSTHLGSLPAESLARIMLCELATEAEG